MKRLIKYAFMTVILFAFIGLSNTFGQDWSKEQKAVWQVVEKGWAGWKAGDSKAAFADVHDRYLGWNNDDPLPISKEKWANMFEMYKTYSKVEYYDLDPARITVEGNSAVVYYYFEFYTSFTWKDKTTEKSIEGRNVEFYIKDGGNWKLLGDMTFFGEDDDDD